jgi:hypothetical protein
MNCVNNENLRKKRLGGRRKPHQHRNDADSVGYLSERTQTRTDALQTSIFVSIYTVIFDNFKFFHLVPMISITFTADLS